MKLSYIFNQTPLTYASLQGNTEVVKLLLLQKGIDVNFKTIKIKKSLIKLKLIFFMVLKFVSIYGINSIFFIIHHWLMLHYKEIQELSNFYYHKKILISTVEQLEIKQFIKFKFFFFLLKLTLTFFMEFNTNIECYTINLCCK